MWCQRQRQAGAVGTTLINCYLSLGDSLSLCLSVTVMAVMNEDNGDNDGPVRRSLITDQMIADITHWPLQYYI